MSNKRRISKLLSLMLRHRPDEFGLEIDEYGFAPLEQVVQAVRERFADASEEEILEVVEGPGQHRFERRGEKVCALYGHSFFVEMDGEPMEAPETLYMGATAGAARRYSREGIASGDRFYVHLSLTRQVAEERSREEGDPIVVEIKAAEAAGAGIAFYERGQVVLTREIPAQFVGQIYGLSAGKEAASQEEKGSAAPAASAGNITYGRRPRSASRR